MEIENYYIKQAGSGLAGFSGYKHQKGYGFFGRLLSGAVMPILRFLGRSALNAGANIANDIVDSDDFSLDNVKNISKKRMRETTKDVIKKGASHILSGSGLRKKKTNKRRKIIKVTKTQRKKTVKRNHKRKNLSKQKKRKYNISAKDFLSL